MSINNNFFQDEIFDTENFENSYYFPPVFSSSDDLNSDYLIDSSDILTSESFDSSDFVNSDIIGGEDVFNSFRNESFISPILESDSGFDRMNPTDALTGVGATPTTPRRDFPVWTDPGYVQSYLRTQIGRYVTVEFLFGTNLLTDKSGLLTEVGINYIILTDASRNNVMCDLYSIKFVTTSTAVEPVPIQQQTLNAPTQMGSQGTVSPGMF